MAAATLADPLRNRLDDATSVEQRVDILVDAAEMSLRGNPREGLRYLVRARRAAEPLTDRRRLWRVNLVTGRCRFELGEYAAALEWFDAALRIAGQLSQNRETAICDSLQGIARVHASTGEYGRAIATLRQGLDLIRPLEEREREANLEVVLGNAYKSIGDYTKGLECYHRSLAFYRDLGNRRGMAIARNNIGSLLYDLEDYDAAYDLFVENVESLREVGDRQFELATMLNIGNILQRRGEFDEALRQHTHALELARSVGSPWNEAFVLNCIGPLHSNRGDHHQGLEALQEGLAIAERMGDSMRWSILGNIGRVCHDMGNYTMAIDYAERSCAGGIEQGERKYAMEAHGLLADCFEATGEMGLALRHYKEKAAIVDELKGQKQQRMIRDLEIRNAVERSEREREILELRNRQLVSESEHRGRELTTMALNLMQKNSILGDVKRELAVLRSQVDSSLRAAMTKLVRHVDGAIRSDDDWEAFRMQFELLHHDFMATLQQRCPALTATELKVCALLKINLSTKETASILSTSTRTIDGHRFNIRRKLGLDKEMGLGAYLTGIQGGEPSSTTYTTPVIAAQPAILPSRTTVHKH